MDSSNNTVGLLTNKFSLGYFPKRACNRIMNADCPLDPLLPSGYLRTSSKKRFDSWKSAVENESRRSTRGEKMIRTLGQSLLKLHSRVSLNILIFPCISPDVWKWFRHCIDAILFFAFLTWNALSPTPSFSTQNAHFKSACTKKKPFCCYSGFAQNDLKCT